MSTLLNKSIWTTSEQKISIGLLILRVGISFSMIYLHGYPRLVNFSEFSSEFADPFGIGNGLSLGLVIFAEFFCSIFLIIGLFVRLSSVPLIITMIVATWIINGGKDFIFQEKSFIYLIAYISLMISGGGRFSIDYLIKRKVNKTKTTTNKT
ncbi:DoxX family protein [Flavobacteriaceae bacterium AH-315-B10]|nr:DoxX family protein [Flavobacteriaceae bacterium AH-315-B10]